MFVEARGHGLHIPDTFLLTKSVEMSRKQNYRDVQRFFQGSQHSNLFNILSGLKFHSKHLSFSLGSTQQQEERVQEPRDISSEQDPTFKALLKKNSLVPSSGNNLKDVQLLQLLLTVKSCPALWGGESWFYPNLLALVLDNIICFISCLQLSPRAVVSSAPCWDT